MLRSALDSPPTSGWPFAECPSLQHPAALPLAIRPEQHTSRLSNDAAAASLMQADIVLPLPLFGRSHFLIFNLFNFDV